MNKVGCEFHIRTSTLGMNVSPGIQGTVNELVDYDHGSAFLNDNTTNACNVVQAGNTLV